MININETTFYEGGPAKSDLIINILAGFTLLGIPFTFAAIVRALWLRYKLTNKRITITGGWLGRTKSQISLNNISEIRSVPRGFGSYGDMVLILKDGSKIEMKSLPMFREKQKFIEDNIQLSKSQPSKEVQGFAK
tara:strand:- start:89 stop:493 length:405 start_codon:yes stop_codon:yes gene_type:complete